MTLRPFVPTQTRPSTINKPLETWTGGQGAYHKAMLWVFLVSPAVSRALNPLNYEAWGSSLTGALNMRLCCAIPFALYIFFSFFLKKNCRLTALDGVVHEEVHERKRSSLKCYRRANKIKWYFNATVRNWRRRNGSWEYRPDFISYSYICSVLLLSFWSRIYMI